MSYHSVDLRGQQHDFAGQRSSVLVSTHTAPPSVNLASPQLNLDQAHLGSDGSFWLIAMRRGETLHHDLVFSDDALQAELSRSRHAVLAVTLMHLVDGTWASLAANRVVVWTPSQGRAVVVAEGNDDQRSLSPPLGHRGRYDVLWSRPELVIDFSTASLSELRNIYPYMFAQEDIDELAVYRGWYPRFAVLCDEIDQLLGADKRGFRWVVALERFGGARYVYMVDECVVRIADKHRHHEHYAEELGPQDEVAVTIFERVKEEQRSTERTCMVCGTPATLSGLKGWVLCLCDAHFDDDIVMNVWESTLVPFEPEIS